MHRTHHECVAAAAVLVGGPRRGRVMRRAAAFKFRFVDDVLLSGAVTIDDSFGSSEFMVHPTGMGVGGGFIKDL